MSLTTMIDACQAVNANIAGVIAAPSAGGMPLNLPSDQLPTAITLPGKAEWHLSASLGRGRRCQRTYVCRYYVAKVDSDAAETFAALLPLMEAVGEAWRATKTVGGALVVKVEDDGALRTQGFGGEQYYGFEYRITVEEVA